MAGTLIRDVRASLDIDVAKAQKGLGDLEKSSQKTEKALKDQEDAARGYQRQLEKTGSAASTMRRRLEAATRSLPKITISADSSEADSTIANLRESLHTLAGQKIGIDVSGTDALAEMRRIKDELTELAATEADPIIRADVQIALREINRVEAELDKLEADTRTVPVDVDTEGVLEEVGGTAAAIRGQLEAATKNLPKIKIDADSSDADIALANLRESLQGLADQRVGIDVSGAQALAEVQRVKHELEELDRMTVDPVIKADVRNTLAELGRVESALGGVAASATSSFATIGQVGPVSVGLTAVAIAALPLVAQVAAAGIVGALGGALVGVGLTAAAQADRVKFAWSETVSALKRDLGDAAAPLEDSAIHASEAAGQAFTALKPILREVFADLGPDVDHFVDGLGDAVEKIGPSLEPLGDAFGTLLDALSDRAGDMGEDIAGTITTLADTTRDHADDIANLFAAITTSIRLTAEGASWLADRWDGFLTANELLHNSLLGINKDYDGSQQGLARLNEAAAGAITAAQGLGTATGEAGTAVRSLSSALEEFFDPAAKALDAEIRLKQALEEATRAAKDKGLSELERMQAVQNTTQAIAAAAKTEAEATGATKDATAAYMDQLPHLLDWAGKNQAAKDTVAALGTSLGVTTLKTKDGTFAVDAFGNAVKLLPSGKTTKVDADTKEGKRQLAEIQSKLDAIKNKTVTLTVKVQQDGTVNLPGGLKANSNARGGIVQYAAAGGITSYASGGMKPHVVSQPSAIIYGEGSSGRGAREAFIPLDEYRSQAVELLGEVADQFGLEVYSRSAAKRMSDAGMTIDATGMQISTGLEAAVGAVTGALGESGTLTSAIEQVGATGVALVDGWTTGSQTISDSVTAMGSTVSTSMAAYGAVTADSFDVAAAATDGLTASVQELVGVIGSAAFAEASGSKSKSKAGGVGMTAEKADVPRKGKAGGVGMTATKADEPRNGKAGMVEGSEPGGLVEGFNAGDFVSSPSAMLSSATLPSVPTAPSPAARPSPAATGGSGSLLSIGSFHASPSQSPHEIAEELSWIGRGG